MSNPTEGYGSERYGSTGYDAESADSVRDVTGDQFSAPAGARAARGYATDEPESLPTESLPGEAPLWPPTEPSTGDDQSTADVAKEQASEVKDTAVDAGKNVAATAKSEAANVAEETKQQAKSLWTSVAGEVKSQAGSQQQKAASSVHALSKELGGMASGSSESGPLTDLAHQAAAKGGELAHWLENKEPRDVLQEVQRFARRRPVAFLALCGLAGVVAGRLTRGAVAANTELDSPSAPKRAEQSWTDSGTRQPGLTDSAELTAAPYAGTSVDPYGSGQVTTANYEDATSPTVPNGVPGGSVSGFSVDPDPRAGELR